MAIQTVNVGTTPNDGTGDPARTCFSKINANFTDSANAASKLVATPAQAIAGTAGVLPDAAQVRRNHVAQAATIADLRALEPAFDGQQVELLGHTVAGVGGGMFYADYSSSAADDNGVTVVTAGGKRWVRRLEGYVTPLMFGAVGDGVADDTLAIQTAVGAAVATGSKLHFVSGETYKITSRIMGGSNLRIEGNGATLDMSNMVGTRTGIEVGGAVGAPQAITSGANVNSYTINVANTSSFAVGDYVQISSNDVYDYGGGSYNVARGEIVQIRSIVLNTSISLTSPLSDTYSTAPVVRPVAWASNVHISNLRIVGEDQVGDIQRGIALRYVKDFSITGCTLINQNTYQIEIASCIFGRVSENRLTGVFYNGVSGVIFYGIAIMDSTQWVEVSGNIGNRSRHLVITTARTSGQGFYGQPRWIGVIGNIMNDAQSGGAGRSYAYENHGFGQFISWIGNQANGCYSLIRLEQGSDNVVANNICNGYGYRGIIIGGNGTKIRNLVVSGNTIKNYTNEVAGGAALSIGASSEMINVNIHGNAFDNVSVGNGGVGISIDASTVMQNISISDNLIRSSSVENTSYAVLTAAAVNGVNFSNLTIIGFHNGYSISGDNVLVRGGRIENYALGGYGYGVYVNSTKCVVTGVHLRNINTAIRLDTASANCLATANTMDNVAVTTPSNAGTGNVTTGNFVL